MKKDYDVGTKRISSSSLKICIKTANSWDQTEEISEDINIIISRYLEKKIFSLFN